MSFTTFAYYGNKYLSSGTSEDTSRHVLKVYQGTYTSTALGGNSAALVDALTGAPVYLADNQAVVWCGVKAHETVVGAYLLDVGLSATEGGAVADSFFPAGGAQADAALNSGYTETMAATSPLETYPQFSGNNWVSVTQGGAGTVGAVIEVTVVVAEN